MVDELDLLSGLVGKGSVSTSKQAKFEASVIATYIAYLPFYENVVLRRLGASGCQYNVLLLDSGSFVESLTAPTTQPRLAGRAYTLVPMRAREIFHPKIALLVGKKHVRVFVGSHNMTLAGFGHNRELSTEVDLSRGKDDSNVAFAQDVWNFLEAWLQHQAAHIPQSILDAALRVVTFAPWLRERTSQTGALRFVGASPVGESLWARIRPMLPESVRQVVVMGAFFDRTGSFLNTLIHDLAPDEVIVGVEPDTVDLVCPPHLSDRVRFVDATSIGRGTGYLHAKALWIEGDQGETVLITGSANPSSPAWTATPSSRNAESVVVHLGSAAQKSAEGLSITAIPYMPELDPIQWAAITKRMARPRDYQARSSTLTATIAEALDEEILLRHPDLDAQAVTAVYGLDHTLKEVWRASGEVRYDDEGLHVDLMPEQIANAGFLQVDLAEGSSIRALVHHSASIMRLSTTSTQQRFRDALDSLDSDSPDLLTIIRLASTLIFEGEELPRNEVRTKQRSGDADAADQEEVSLGSLVVSIEETKRYRRQARALRAGDLAYIIDILIYQLGVGLRSAAEQLEDIGLSEEEQIGEEEDFQLPLQKAPDVDIVGVCQSKIRILVSRMLKQLDIAKSQKERVHQPVEQLLAVLAVLREVRAQDRRLAFQTSSQSLVPREQRQRLLEGALAALFGRQQKLYDAATLAFADDPANDLSRLLGLMLWLAWDCGLDARKTDKTIFHTKEEERERLQDNAKLLELAMRAANDEAALEEVRHSIWRTAAETAKGAAHLWVTFHRAWGQALADLWAEHRSWRSLRRKPQSGDLGFAIKEEDPKLRVVLSANNGNVHLAELGEHSGTVKFRSDFVAVTEMPSISF